MAEKVANTPKTRFSKPMEAAEPGEGAVDPRSGHPIAGLHSRSAARPRAFFDSNILLYADDSRFLAKQKIAAELILEHRRRNAAVLSLQILQEYYSNATRKLQIDPKIAKLKVETYSRFHLVEPELADVLAAIDLSRLHMISYYDAAIVHCARKSGCAVLYTEDLQHNQLIDGVRIVNPFL